MRIRRGTWLVVAMVTGAIVLALVALKFRAPAPKYRQPTAPRSSDLASPPPSTVTRPS